MVDTTGPPLVYDSPFSAIDDFACKVFKHVREKMPEAKLAYNDFSHESMVWNASSTKVYNFVKDLRDRDCGPDIVGFENHF
jgi:GH35 family endo-1,4-beta-xylanase